MATKLPSPEQINEARKKEADAKQALDSFNESTRGGVNLTTIEQNKQNKLKKAFDTARKEREVLEKPIKELEKTLSRVNQSIKQAQNAARNPQSRLAANAAIRELEKEKQAIEKSLTELTPYQQPVSSSPSTPSPPRVQGPPMGPPSATPEQLARFEAEQKKKTGATTTGTGGVPLTPQEKAEKRKDREEQRFEKAAAEFRKMAPQYAWILDIDQAKYPDVRKLIKRAIKGEMFKSPEGLQRFIGELNGTTFFTELREKGTKQKIVNLVGDLGFDDANMGKLLANATNLQWDDDTLSLEVYKEAFRKNEDGTYVHAQAEARARKSSSYLRIQNIGTSFFNQLDDDTVERVLTGGMIEDDVLRQQRELAKARYGHLANLIDQGLSLDAITRSYRDEAARLLERDPNDIRMADAMYQTAYDFTDESGQKRLMTTGEWTRQLRTDTQYGWDKTENAKREARQLSSSIIQAFGRVM
jgi:hypothetical protein